MEQPPEPVEIIPLHHVPVIAGIVNEAESHALQGGIVHPA